MRFPIYGYHVFGVFDKSVSSTVSHTRLTTLTAQDNGCGRRFTAHRN